MVSYPKVNSESIFNSPRKLILVLASWWLFWIIVANLESNKFIHPVHVTPLVISFILFLISPYFFLRKKSEKFSDLDLKLNDRIFYTLIIIGLYLLTFKAIPAIIRDPIGYRLSTFNDNNSGIQSVLFPNAKLESLFNLFFLQFPLALVLLSTVCTSRKLFNQAIVLLLLYSIIRLWRGGIYIGFVYYFFSGFAISQKKKSSVIFNVSFLFFVFCLFYIKWLRDEIIVYHTVGFSLLENILPILNSDHGDKFYSLSLIFGNLGSFLRLFNPYFFFDFEIFSANFSTFIDVGRYDNLAYNAFYTFLVAPIYDFGLLGPALLGCFFAFLITITTKIKSSAFLKRAILVLIFHLIFFGIFQNTISDSIIITYSFIIVVYRSSLKGFIFSKL